MYVAVGDESAGLIAVAHTLTPKSRQAVERPEALGLDAWMLTGDNRATAEGSPRAGRGLRPAQHLRLVRDVVATRSCETNRDTRTRALRRHASQGRDLPDPAACFRRVAGEPGGRGGDRLAAGVRRLWPT